MNIRKQLILNITDLSLEGNGVAHTEEGQTVFVPQALVGETVLAEVTAVKKRFLTAALLEVQTPSPMRITEVDCPYFERCGGCDYRHISYEDEVKIKEHQLTNTLNRAGLSPKHSSQIPKLSQKNRYRNKVEFQIDFSSGVPHIGFFEKHSHHLIEVEDCLLLPEAFIQIKTSASSLLRKMPHTVLQNTPPLSLSLRESSPAGQIMVNLRFAQQPSSNFKKLLEELRILHPNIAQTGMQVSARHKNTSAPSKMLPVYGENIINHLSDMDFELSPASFFQVNGEVATQLYAATKNALNLSSDDVLLDLFCGTGTIGLTIAADIKRVVGIDLTMEAIQNAKENARRNKVKNAHFYAGDAFRLTKEIAISPTAVVLDPPRAGASEKLLQLINTLSPEKIAMISCNPLTMARDLRLLTSYGYTLVSFSGFNMFPRTHHMETLSLLERPTR